MTEDKTTHFGFETVNTEEKAQRVRAVFDSVATRYDLMNDLMSMGIHRLWKRFAIEMTGLKRGQKVLDLASGTGDLASRFAGLVGPEGLVVMTDINNAMLAQGRMRMADDGLIGNVVYSQVNAESIPFPDNTFDCVTIAFGLRNVTDKQQALSEMRRVIKPGGRVMVLEFSHPKGDPLKAIYDIYSFKILPFMGKVVAKDEESYRYLAESIRMHPDQETLKGMMEEAGLERCEYHNLTGGIVAVHRGYKL